MALALLGSRLSNPDHATAPPAFRNSKAMQGNTLT
jgi:hypothetical protein